MNFGGETGRSMGVEARGACTYWVGMGEERSRTIVSETTREERRGRRRFAKTTSSSHSGRAVFISGRFGIDRRERTAEETHLLSAEEDGMTRPNSCAFSSLSESG
jgi:hypothetical protein